MDEVEKKAWVVLTQSPAMHRIAVGDTHGEALAQAIDTLVGQLRSAGVLRNATPDDVFERERWH